MSMSRKHYTEIAGVLSAEVSISRDNPEVVLAVKALTMSLADVFARDNSRFDRARFYAAVGI